MHEIVTLSTGNYSSFVLAHFFNIQEASFSFDPSFEPEVDHNVLFQENTTQDGQSAFTPRLVAFDLRRNFRTQRLENVLFNPRRDHVPHHLSTNAGSVEKHEAASFKKNQFLQDVESEEQEMLDNESEGSDKSGGKAKGEGSGGDGGISGGKKYRLGAEDVKQWSDFLGVYLHPRSLNMINDYGFGPEKRFDTFPFGESLVRNADNYEEYFEGSLRFFVEGCDNLQGFHAVSDVGDGFGGFGSAMLECVREEYSKKSIFTFGAQPVALRSGGATTKSEIERRILNESFLVVSMHESSSMYVPFVGPSSTSNPLLSHYDPHSRYHSSGLLGAFLDNSTLPYRRRRSPQLMNDLVSQLNWQNGARIADATMMFPFPVKRESFFEDSFSDLHTLSASTILLSGQPKLQIPMRANSESVVLRGLSSLQLFANAQPKESIARYRKCRNAKEMVYEYMKDLPRASSHCHEFKEAFSVPKTFPPMFSDKLDHGGFQRPPPPVGEGGKWYKEVPEEVESLPCVSMLRNSDATKSRISQLVNGLKAINPKMHSTFFENKDAFDETVEQLENIVSLYARD